MQSSCLDRLWVVSIYDREPAGEGATRLAVDVGHIVRALEPQVGPLLWLVNLWEWEGPRNLLEQAGLGLVATPGNQLLDTLLTTEQLLHLYSTDVTLRTLDGEFRAITPETADEEVDSFSPFAESQALLEIKAWQDSFTVITRDPTCVQTLKDRFHLVREEDPEGFC